MTKPAKIELNKNATFNEGEFQTLAAMDDRAFKVFVALLMCADDKTGDGFTSLSRITEMHRLHGSPDALSDEFLRALLKEMAAATLVISLSWMDADAFTYRLAPRER